MQYIYTEEGNSGYCICAKAKVDCLQEKIKVFLFTRGFRTLLLQRGNCLRKNLKLDKVRQKNFFPNPYLFLSFGRFLVYLVFFFFFNLGFLFVLIFCSVCFCFVVRFVLLGLEGFFLGFSGACVCLLKCYTDDF